MARKPAKTDRIGELEDEIKTRDRRIEDLRREIDEERDLVRRLCEHVEDADNVIERWKEAFDMTQTEDGNWTWGPFWDEHNALVDDYNDFVRRWNKYVPVLNGLVQPVGRPLGASEAEVETVHKLRKRGMSLRGIADETNLSFQTVRTIVGKANGTDRVTKRRWQKVHLGEAWEQRSYEPLGRIDNRAQATRWKRQRRTGNALPRQAQRVVEEGRELVKEAKGLK